MEKKDTLAVKGIAILCMLFHHLFDKGSRYTIYHFSGLILNQSITRQIASDCQVCVAIFAFLSGYGMTKRQKQAGDTNLSGAAFCRQSLQSYWKLIKDTVLLTPLLILITAIFGFSKTPASLWGESALQQIWGAFTNMTGTAGFCGQEWLVSSWWYLKMAVSFIAIFPLLYLVMRKCGSVCLIVTGFVLVPNMFGIDIAKSVKLWRYLAAFAGGMILAETEGLEQLKQWCGDNGKRLAAACGLLLMALAVSVCLRHHTNAHYLVQTLQAGIISALTMLTINRIPGVRSGLRFLGKHSRYMWLIHVYIYGQVMTEWLFSLHNIWLIYGTLVLISLAVSIILKSVSDWFYQGLGKLRLHAGHRKTDGTGR